MVNCFPFIGISTVLINENLGNKLLACQRQNEDNKKKIFNFLKTKNPIQSSIAFSIVIGQPQIDRPRFIGEVA